MYDNKTGIILINHDRLLKITGDNQPVIKEEQKVWENGENNVYREFVNIRSKYYQMNKKINLLMVILICIITSTLKLISSDFIKRMFGR